MGRGDTKTERGKISKGSHGNSRPKHKKKIKEKKDAALRDRSGSGR